MKMMIRPAKITHSMLLDMAKRAKADQERTIFLHYTWGSYGEVYDEYHLCIDASILGIKKTAELICGFVKSIE